MRRGAGVICCSDIGVLLSNDADAAPTTVTALGYREGHCLAMFPLRRSCPGRDIGLALGASQNGLTRRSPMRRRDFIALLGAAAIARPLATRAQPRAPLARIGILTNGGNPKSPLFEAFSKKMAELGYIEGRTLVTEFRSADGDAERLIDLAMGLARVPVQVIVTDGAYVAARAAQRATSTIPIVMATAPPNADSLGLVRSLAHPGGNITGFTMH